jgi:hypothetical protein
MPAGDELAVHVRSTSVALVAIAETSVGFVGATIVPPPPPPEGAFTVTVAVAEAVAPLAFEAVNV